jgi:hypothetical protein
MLLDNNYNISKNVEIGGNCILEKYLMKINSQSILNIWQTCVEMVEVLYIILQWLKNYKVEKKTIGPKLKSKLPT